MARRSSADRKRRYEADSPKFTLHWSATVLPAASRWSTAVRCSFSSGSTATRKPCTSSAAASFSVAFRITSGSLPGPGTRPRRVS